MECRKRPTAIGVSPEAECVCVCLPMHVYPQVEAKKRPKETPKILSYIFERAENVGKLAEAALLIFMSCGLMINRFSDLSNWIN